MSNEITSNQPPAGHASTRPLDGFHVTDEKTASWVARKINEARAHQRRVRAWAERELKRAQRREAFFLSRFGSELETWARAELARNGRHKSKSIHLPGGTLSFRAERQKLLVTDDRLLMTWARTNLPTAIRVVESVSNSDLNRYLAETGEIADGTEFSDGGERFLIR
jgi:hypothetical protein